jgi:ribosomal protein S18 acetylase RimI-like enzyme
MGCVVESLERLSFREADAADAAAIAALHADSWRRTYRGAYADEFLDGDVDSDRLAVWSARLRAADPARRTVVVHDGDVLSGFVHVVLDDDARWGSLVDNLHVAHALKRRGIGTRLIVMAAGVVVTSSASPAMYLWVHEENAAARVLSRSWRCRGRTRAGRGARGSARTASRVAGQAPGRVGGRHTVELLSDCRDALLDVAG